MTLPASIRSNSGAREEHGQIALTRMRMPTPYNLETGKDYYQVLRRMLEQALTANRSAERTIAKQKSEIDRLRTLSITDEHTGLLNRRGFSDALARTMARAQRYCEPAVLLLIDLDGFKSINDTYGHAAGDLVLLTVAKNLKRVVRQLDDVARLGGDEFAIILNNAPENTANRHAREIERHLNGITVSWNDEQIRVRASVGNHGFGPGTADTAQSIYERADHNMYFKKRNGGGLSLKAPDVANA